MATSTNFRRVAAVLASALLLPGAFVAACSSDNNNPQPTTPVYTIPDTGTSQLHSDDSGSGLTSADSAGGGGNEDAPLTQKDGALVLDAASCLGDAGCWSCSPTSAADGSPAEFLNQCTSSQCSPFANASRLPNYDGGLPPLN